jgi:hypothetical protein
LNLRLHKLFRSSTLGHSRIIAIGALLIALGAAGGIASAQRPRVPASGPLEADPVCKNICDKSGVNFAYPVRQPTDDYLRAQRLGMGWELEIAYMPVDLLRTAEAMNRALDHGLQPILRICAGSTCAFSDPYVYSDFLHDLAPLVNGDFWALMGPNEPDLEPWAGGAEDVAWYMNTMLDLVADIPNLRTVSPAFNSTNGITHKYFKAMEDAGARFGDLDAFAATSYSVAGNGAYYYYASNTGHSEKLRQKALRFNKQVIFVEYGTFDMFNKPNENDKGRAKVVSKMRSEFNKAAKDPTVLAILHYDAFGTNGSPHKYYDKEMIEIARDQTCVNGSMRGAGIGIFTNTTVWQLSGEDSCREFAYGCPFLNGSTCSGNYCIDNDADGLYGDGGVCTRTDCDDTDPAIGESCGQANVLSSAWGTVHTVDDSVADRHTDIWPTLAIGHNGYPLIAYHHDVLGTRDLNLIECTSPACQTGLRRVLVSDDWSGTSPSIAVRHNGLPVLVHFDMIDEDLELYDCLDAGCVTGQRRIIDYTTGFYGLDTSLAIRPSGRPIVAYWDSVLGHLNVFDCFEEACTSGESRILDESPNTGQDPTVIIDALGQPLIAYGKAGTQVMRLYDCLDADCLTGERVTIDYTPSSAHATRGIALRHDGTPFVVYRDWGNGNLRMIDCHDAACATFTEGVLDNSGNMHEATVAILLDGAPFIAYRDETPSGENNLKLIRCHDPSCLTFDTETVVAGGLGRYTDIALRPDGNPLVVFFDVVLGDLKVYDVDLALVPGGVIVTPTPSPIPTETPTPQPTPIPPGPLLNGSFEQNADGNTLPDFWTGSNLKSTDALDCAHSFDGTCSFHIVGNGSGKKLQQTLDIVGGAGETITVSLWSEALNVSGSGAYRVRMIVTYDNGDKKTVQTNFNTGTHAFEQAQANLVTTRAYKRIQVLIEYSRPKGEVWFDNASLTIQP